MCGGGGVCVCVCVCVRPPTASPPVTNEVVRFSHHIGRQVVGIAAAVALQGAGSGGTRAQG